MRERYREVIRRRGDNTRF